MLQRRAERGRFESEMALPGFRQARRTWRGSSHIQKFRMLQNHLKYMNCLGLDCCVLCAGLGGILGGQKLAAKSSCIACSARHFSARSCALQADENRSNHSFSNYKANTIQRDIKSTKKSSGMHFKAKVHRAPVPVLHTVERVSQRTLAV